MPRLTSKLVYLLAAAAVLMSCAGPTATRVVRRHPGVWQSQGYGYVLAVDGRRVRLFDVAGDVCVEQRDLDASVLPFFDRARLEPDGATMVLASALDSYEFRFARAPALPRACTPPTANTPRANFEAFAAFFAHHYAFFGLYGVDWASRVAAARERVTGATDDAALFAVLRELVLPLTDSHIKIEAEFAGAKHVHDGDEGPLERSLAADAARRGVEPRQAIAEFRRAYWFDGIGQALLAGRGTVAANQRIQYGMLPGDVGYLALVSMGGFVDGDYDSLRAELPALDAAMEAALALFAEKGAHSVIVDASLNIGGYDFIALALAGRFAAAPALAYTRRAADDPQAREFAIHVEPAKGRRFLGQVYVMTSSETVSAGEILTLALRALPNGHHAGELTRGAFSTVLEKRLPNGWLVGLSNERYTDPQGECWEGRGIPPQIPLPVFGPENHDGHVAAIRALLVQIGKDAEIRSTLQ
ncbi:S41 family peptidase [Nannocystis sp. SCPEA4]|uniref:S41 family peptidase n=1 Tax=Nannocystis sp. SCPEA4 TaxID=2996787 RepID=UPI00226E1AD9|nr:S41 family peptidase [Nannocystis sp. SCPEA4]MCY1060129.1 S41 family peptidase [Nannocystis sp. SCPEA4]